MTDPSQFTTTPASGGPTLKRAVTRWEIVALAVNDVIGSGVYLLPATATALLGSASLWAVLLAGFAVALLVLCYAEASSHFDQAGGSYLYARAAFGDLVGCEVGWMTWLARVSSVASLSVGFAQALSYLVPEVQTGMGRLLAIVLPLAVLTAINIVGVKAGVRTAAFLAVTKTLPLLLFIGVGVLYARASQVAAQGVGKPGAIGEAALLLLFAYAGFENTTAPAGEFKNPRRDLPFALLTQIAIVTLVYFGVQWVAMGTLPNLSASVTPLADSAASFLGPWGGLLLTVGGAISILGTNSNSIFAGPRYLYALSRHGFLPRVLGSVHPRFRTPAVAVLVQSAIALPLALSGSFAGLAALSVLARLASYIGTAAAVPVLRKKLGPSAFQLPGGPTIPILAIGISLFLAASATRRNLIAAGIALLFGLVLYALRRKPDDAGVEDTRA